MIHLSRVAIQFWLLLVVSSALCHAEEQVVDEVVDANFVAPPTEQVDVCVIGAGPSGVQAAYTAHNKGLSVKLIEKNSYIGGKTKLVRLEGEEDDPYPLGAVIHFFAHDTSIEGLLNKFNIPRFTLSNYEWMDQDGPTRYQLPMIGRLIGTAILFIKRFLLSRWLDSPDAFTTDYPAELNMPFNDWLDKYYMSALKPTMWRSATCHGYGDQNIVPALYPLRASSTALIAAIFQREFYKFFDPSSDTGTIERVHFQELLEAMAGTLPDSSVVLGANINQVDYGSSADSNTTLYYTTADQDGVVSCGSTVIAFSQTSNTMKDHFIPPKANGLEELLTQVHTVNYYSVLYEDKDDKFPRDAYYLREYPTIPDKPALNTLVARILRKPGSSIVAYYLSPSDKTNEEALSESINHYEKLLGTPLNQEGNSTSFVQDFNYWQTYSPHVLQEDLDAGFYKKFDAYQGMNRQYYVGGLFNGETVQSSMQHGEHIIDRFFSDETAQTTTSTADNNAEL